MVKVILRNGWNAPGQFYRKSVSKKGPPVDIPHDVVYDDSGKSRLPTTAEIVSDDYVTPVVKPGADTFSGHRAELDANDPDRAAAVAQGRAMEKADADRLTQQVKNKRKFAAELAAEEAEVEPEPSVALDLEPEVAPAPPKGGKKGKK